jgi:hypothetical protein
MVRPSIPSHAIADQFAFRRSGSTTAALVYLMHHVTSFLENNNYVRCLLVDFSKAFDIGFCNSISFASLLFAADQTLLNSICKRQHCLHSILPPVKSTQYYLLERGIELLLPDFRTCLQKNRFF